MRRKIYIIFLLVNFACFGAYCQTGERFNYETSQFNDAHCAITLKHEKSISKNAKSVECRFVDAQYSDSLMGIFSSVVEKSISSEKRQKLAEMHIGIYFSIVGKEMKIRMVTPKKNMEVLNEDDLYVLFSNLQKMELDMSKCTILYPPNWEESAEAVLVWMFPVKQKK